MIWGVLGINIIKGGMGAGGNKNVRITLSPTQPYALLSHELISL